MMYANSGNLDNYLSSHRSSHHLPGFASDPPTPSHDQDATSSTIIPPTAEDLKARFRARKKSGVAATREDEGEKRAVMLLSREEVGGLFGDVVAGLAFLVRISRFGSSSLRRNVDVVKGLIVLV